MSEGRTDMGAAWMETRDGEGGGAVVRRTRNIGLETKSLGIRKSELGSG